MSFFSSLKAKRAFAKLAEQQLYDQAASEIASGHIRRGLWAKALADENGDETAAKSRYLKHLVETLKAEQDIGRFMHDQAAKESAKAEYSSPSQPTPKPATQHKSVDNNEAAAGDLLAIVIVILVAFVAIYIAVNSR